MRIGLLAVVLVGSLLIVGCLDDDRIDRKPPRDQGSIVVDNRTSSDMDVYINGEKKDRVRSRRWRAYDYEPGVYRVVLDERHGDRNYRGDVDVLDRRLSILEITNDFIRRDRYSVFVYFD